MHRLFDSTQLGRFSTNTNNLHSRQYPCETSLDVSFGSLFPAFFRTVLGFDVGQLPFPLDMKTNTTLYVSMASLDSEIYDKLTVRLYERKAAVYLIYLSGSEAVRGLRPQ